MDRVFLIVLIALALPVTSGAVGTDKDLPKYLRKRFMAESFLAKREKDPEITGGRIFGRAAPLQLLEEKEPEKIEENEESAEEQRKRDQITFDWNDGSFSCTCNPGFASSGDGRYCWDINECNLPNHGCEHGCVNTRGSYECLCEKGYEKAIDGSGTCHDIDECKRFYQNGRGLRCMGNCNNTLGSYECTCPYGFELSNDRHGCSDIDECSLGTADCGRWDQICVNTRGGFRCNSIVCPNGYENYPGDQTRCRRTYPCAVDDQACMTAPWGISHTFFSFPSETRIPDFFTQLGPDGANKRLQFDLHLLSAKDPETGESRVTRDFFYLELFYNKGVVTLQRQIQGPQDVELELEMKIFTNGRYSSSAVAKIFLYFTKNEF